MNEWGAFLNDVGQSLVLNRVSELTAPAAPVAKDPLTGTVYKEGQPAPTGVLAGIPHNYLIGGGVVAALLLAAILLRK